MDAYEWPLKRFVEVVVVVIEKKMRERETVRTYVTENKGYFSLQKGNEQIVP
jgi:hypothetical protein